MEVEIAGVCVDREGRRVLDIPSLTLPGQQTSAILGPNGSGKTTLLRLIAGLERPRGGTVLVGGETARSGRAAYVFQEQVFLRRSVRHNLELGLQLRGVNRAETQLRVEHAVTLLGIAHLTERRADRLSGGEARRVSIARALCLRAPVVLLDEPLAGLDERTYSRMVDELPHILAAFGTTTVLVTHNRDEALRLAQNLVVLIGGKVLAAGDPREVALNPRGVEVAEALGYSVLTVNGRQVAVPRGALRIGPGHPEFAMMVDGVLDLADSRFVVGRIGDVRVHVPLSGTVQLPTPGDRVLVHSQRVSELN